MTGTLVAQAIPVAVSPLLTRLYSPDEFGIFAVYSAIVAVLAVASTGRYELALNLPRSDLVAVHLVVLASLWIACAALFAAVVTWSALPWTNLGWIYALLPVSILLAGAVQVLNYWLNRQKRFRSIALSRALQGAAFALVGLGFGAISLPEGLILAFMAGQLASLAVLSVSSLSELSRHASKLRRGMLGRTALRYRDFPRVLIVAHSLNMISSRLPILVMPASFGAAAAGFYSLTQQVIGLPMQLVGGAIGDVFRQQASTELRDKGSCRAIYLRTLRTLVLLYAMPFIVLLTLSPALFAFVFGEDWERAGLMAQILAPMFYIQFVSSPLSSMFLIAEKQREDLFWQSALVVLTGGALALGWLYGSIEVCTMLFSASYSIMYLINLAMTYRFALGTRSQT
ncbi:MAG TPA: oligosaccharide flippase family protein [Devosia sp.]|jgi:O-antigen/teichoic acid export membrane protein|uniref:oligosaccharide flippase family protein n=1 Tax=Devosia sp. TaxID=1871048 RepID=UPI002F925063